MNIFNDVSFNHLYDWWFGLKKKKKSFSISGGPSCRSDSCLKCCTISVQQCLLTKAITRWVAQRIVPSNYAITTLLNARKITISKSSHRVLVTLKAADHVLHRSVILQQKSISQTSCLTISDVFFFFMSFWTLIWFDSNSNWCPLVLIN